MGQSDVVNESFSAEPLPAVIRPSHVRYYVLALACIIAVIIYIHRLGFASAAPDIKKQFEFGADQQGRIMAAFLVAYALFEIPWGILSDRFGVRHVLTLVVAGSSFTTAAAALLWFFPGVAVYPYAFLLSIRFGFGMFQAGVFPAISRMMTDWMPSVQRATAQGLIWMSSRIGGALAPLLIVELIVLQRNWASPLIIISCVTLPACLVIWFWFRNRPEDMKQVNEAERAFITAGRSARPLGHGHIPWRLFLGSRSVWALCFMYSCGGLAANFFVTYLPTYLKEERHLTDDQTKWLTSLPLACGIAGCLLGGYASDWIIRRWGNRKWGRRLTGTCGTLLAGIGYLSIIWIREPWLLGVVLCLIFFCNDIGMGPAWASCADIGKRYAGTLGGAMNMIGNFGEALGNLIAGQFFKQHQAWLVFLIFALSYWLGALCWQGVDVTRPLEETHET